VRRRLRARGVGPDRVVGVCHGRSPELVVAVLATRAAGGAFLPMDPAYPRDRLAFMLRDAGAVPLPQRQAVNALVAAENRDRNALYAEIANANGHPEWQAEIRSTFAQRWMQRAQPGWWVQSGGGWSQK